MTRPTGLRSWALAAAVVLPAPLLVQAEGAGAMTARSDTRTSLPNVLVVMVDDMRTDDLPHMPHVQRLLVRQGARFSNFYAPLSWCCPARASFLTGQYPHNHDVYSNAPPRGGFPALRDKETLATWLHPRYTTGFVGKYLNAYGPSTESSTYVPPGWDVWEAAYGTSAFHYRDLHLNMDGKLRDFSPTYATEVIQNRSVAFLRSQVGDRKPFFLWSSFLAPHVGVPHEPEDPTKLPGYGTPYVDNKYRNTYTGALTPQNPSFNEKDVSDKPAFIRSAPRMGPVKVAATKVSMAQRRESLRSVDDAVARLVRQLRNIHELGRTYIIFVSDNGYMQGEHRILHGKAMPYEPSSRLPLVIRGPHVPRDVVRDGVFAQPDLAPTILALAHRRGQPDITLDGRSMLRALREPSFGEQRAVLLEAVAAKKTSEQSVERHRYGPHQLLRERGTNARDDLQWRYRAVVTRGWKLIIWPRTGATELYPLFRDPHELENVASDPLYSPRLRELRARLNELRYCSGDDC